MTHHTRHAVAHPSLTVDHDLRIAEMARPTAKAFPGLPATVASTWAARDDVGVQIEVFCNPGLNDLTVRPLACFPDLEVADIDE